MSIYRITTTFGETTHFHADLSQASSPICHVDDETHEIGSSTQYQTADARHDLRRAAELYLSVLGREWYASPDDCRDDDDIIEDVIDDVESLLSIQMSDHAWDEESTLSDGRHIAREDDEIYVWADEDDTIGDAGTWETISDEVLDIIDADELVDLLGLDLRRIDDTDVSEGVQWIEESENRTWALPTYGRKIGQRVVMWTLTDEAGLDDVIVAEAESDLTKQVREYAECIASDLGTLVDDISITLTDDMIRELCVLTTRDEAGRHFTEWSDYYEQLEALGLIEISRPTHEATGLDYDCQFWSVELTASGLDVVEANPELHPE